jgi:hypothetical protein
MVASSEGITQIRLPSPPPDLLHEDVEAWKEALRASRVPLGVLTWGDAHLGEEGWCELEEPAQITISGRIVTPDGEPAPDALVNGCVGGSTFPDEHGHFEMQAWRGAPCTLSVNRAGIPGDGVEVSRDGDQHGIVMVQEPIDASVAIDQHAAELERQQAQLHPLEVALEDPDLSAEARALLDGWLEEEREETERIIAISEHHAGFFFEAQEREDQE